MSLLNWFRKPSPPPEATNDEIMAGIIQLQLYQRQIMTTLSSLATTLNAIQAKLEKAKAEIISEIDNLKTSLTDTPLPADAEASLSNLETLATALDDIVPDAPASV
jgi:hypothetical protein